MENKPKVDITDPQKEWKHKHPVGEEGGVKIDLEADAGFLSSAKSLVYDMGSKALKGQLDFSEMVLPAAMLSEYTRLEIISFEFQPLCKYVHAAAHSDDPLERVKYITAGYVASVTSSIAIQNGVPPIPSYKGDTLEGTDEYGTKLLITHDSHKQDVSIVNIQGPEGEFKIDCEWENIIKFRGINISNVSGKKAKPKVITFKDGGKVTVTTAEYELDGALSSSKIFRMTGAARIEDEKNKIVSIVTFVPNPTKGGMLSGFFSKPAEIKPSDLNKVTVDIQKDGKTVAKGQGQYTAFLELDGKVYWRATDHNNPWIFKDHAEHTTKLKKLIKEKNTTEYDALSEELRKKHAPVPASPGPQTK